MTDPNHEELIPSIIAAAVAAAGPKGTNEGQWKAKVNDAIPHIASMLGPGGRQWRIAEEVLGASVFVATYVDHAVEESSTRCLVHIDTGKSTKNYPDGIEPIRTHRTDNAQGRSMKARLDKLEPGDEIVVWKSIEASDDGNEKYRVLVHFETRPKRKVSPTGESRPRPGEGRPVESEGSAAPDSGSPADEDSFAYAFNDLTSKDKIAVVARLREEQITFPEPQPDKANRFLTIIDEVTR